MKCQRVGKFSILMLVYRIYTFVKTKASWGNKVATSIRQLDITRKIEVLRTVQIDYIYCMEFTIT